LGICQAQELIECGKTLGPVISAVSAHADVELMLWEILKQLPKDRMARVHGHPPELSGEYHPGSHSNSNRKKNNWVKEHKELGSYRDTFKFNRTVVIQNLKNTPWAEKALSIPDSRFNVSILDGFNKIVESYSVVAGQCDKEFNSVLSLEDTASLSMVPEWGFDF
jgi:hypothetical protein